MNRKVDELLKNNQYTIKEVITQEGMLDFIKIWANKNSIITKFYQAFLFASIFVTTFALSINGAGIKRWILDAGIGLVIMALLIPVHELIHGLVYKIVGAEDIRYGKVEGKPIFYAVAHDFVIGYRDFMCVAFAPFTAINVLAMTVAVIFPNYVGICGFITIFNVLTSGGDFALVNYMHHHKSEGVVTYDDHNLKESYMLIKK